MQNLEEVKLKWKIEKKYLTIGFITLGVVVIGIWFQYFLENERRFEEVRTVITGTMWPILVGFIMAYLLNPVLKFFEGYVLFPLSKHIFRGKKKELHQKKFSRGFGIFLTLIFFFVILFGGLYLVIPQVYSSLTKMVEEAPNYYSSIEKWFEKLGRENSEFNEYVLIAFDQIYEQGITYLNEDILPNMDMIVAEITSGIVLGLKAVLNCILAIIISVYVMLEKETLISVAKKITCSFLNHNQANTLFNGVRYMNQVFGGFINGKIIDSFIIGAICYGFMSIFNFDYAVLISIIVGITNVIPYFGPFMGGIPCFLILLMINYKQGLAFGIFIIILQQIDGNIIGPIILGDRLKISSMWVLFAILVGGGFYGVPGMILGAPCFACIYALIGTFCKSKLMSKNLPIETNEYLAVDHLTSDYKIVLKETEDLKMLKNTEESKKMEIDKSEES